MNDLSYGFLVYVCVTLTGCAHLPPILSNGPHDLGGDLSNAQFSDESMASFNPDAVAAPALPAAPPALGQVPSTDQQELISRIKLEETEKKLQETERVLEETRLRLAQAEKKLSEVRSETLASSSASKVEIVTSPAQVIHSESHVGSSTILSNVVQPIGSGSTQMYVNGDQINIRMKPDRTAKIVGIAYGGQPVRVTLNGEWAKLDEGKWLRSRWLSHKKPKKYKDIKPVELSRSLSVN